ncbi:P-loop containing nucleoside triphosphate hydrolase protein [Mycena galericulata]|nr:P-loop containing nucleoside triphosphate hydrolase protein [Mycena galericulata]
MLRKMEHRYLSPANRQISAETKSGRRTWARQRSTRRFWARCPPWWTWWVSVQRRPSWGEGGAGLGAHLETEEEGGDFPAVGAGEADFLVAGAGEAAGLLVVLVEGDVVDIEVQASLAIQFVYSPDGTEAKVEGNGNVIACTQPRRVAATSVAGRVAAEVGSLLGDEVGYTIRFEDVSDKERTRILYMTDGMLFRETLVDPLLSRYSVIMIDEAHERSVYTDLLLGVLKKIRRKRPTLRLIVSSATLDATAFLDYFTASTSPEEATIVSLEGRMYPVEVAYLKEPAPDYVRKAAEVAWNINLQQGTGDILVFLTGLS